ncbi:MAG: hypothetical protein J6C43_02445 [Oscillospiraceae bacterium]|nr:hypothetical protein [Oscillospiraceae bacterium]
MKKYILLLLFLAFLPGCAGIPQETPTPTETPVPTAAATPEPAPTDTDPEIYAEVPISLLDLSSYEGSCPMRNGKPSGGSFLS